MLGPVVTNKDFEPEIAGQCGDLQGLSRAATVDSESVEELAEEGQDFEAEIVRGVQDAPEPDQGEVNHEGPGDDTE